MEIKQILCPIDFSEFSRNALDYAIALARWYGSEISVVHVVPEYLAHPDQFPYAAEPLTPPKDFRDHARRQLENWVHQAGIGDMADAVRLEEGETADEILLAASRLRADLIVMGTHGRTGFERFVLGSVTEKVLRKATCPVLTVTHAPQLGDYGEVHLRGILVPFDFSAVSAKASEYAFSIARETEAPVYLLHVVEHFIEPYSAVQWTDALEFHRERLRSEAKECLRKIPPAAVRAQLKLEELVETGRGYQRILELADEKQIDLIVMGIRGRSALNMALFGSTTNHVVRAAPCPVLTIRTD